MGKHKYIETPEKLLEMFLAYKDKVQSNPRVIDKALQSGKVVQEKLRVPLTYEGFEVFGYEQGVTLDHYFRNTNGAYEDYCGVCQRIKREIRQDQIEGGMVGQYNPSITQRLNNLTEKTDVTSNGENINEIKISIIRPDTKELE
jgi:hypothetical protein